MRKDHTQKVQKTDTRSLSAEEIDLVVGGAMKEPSAYETTCSGPVWRPIGLPKIPGY